MEIFLPSDVCVASVGNIMDGRILIHFDGWEPDFDFWSVPSSTCIHKVGYCEETGIKLHSPRGIFYSLIIERTVLIHMII